jgi:hypothetical protein
MTILNLYGKAPAPGQKAKRIRVVFGLPVYIVAQRLGECLGDGCFLDVNRDVTRWGRPGFPFIPLAGG